MRFAIIYIGDGSIRQINETFGSKEPLEQINTRLFADELLAIECSAEVGLEHIWDAGTARFNPPGQMG